MMVKRYSMPISDEPCSLYMPCTPVLHVAIMEFDNNISLWAVDDGSRYEERRFVTQIAGEDFKIGPYVALQHVGSCVDLSANVVWHVFEHVSLNETSNLHPYKLIFTGPTHGT